MKKSIFLLAAGLLLFVHSVYSAEEVFYSFPMDSNPGWSTEGDWAFGQPQGLSGDPSSGYTGSNVYGYNLAGDYPDFMDKYRLTTTALDCSTHENITLSFYRWLGVEKAIFDHAEIEVSNNGVTWTTVWSHSGSDIADTSWQLMNYDISSVADGQSTVYIRWGMGTTDYSVTFHGWNIDDVQLSGDVVPSIFVNASRPDDTGDGLSWATAKKTLQAGVDAADQHNFYNVLVAPGIYNSGGKSDFEGGSTYQMSRVNMSYINLKSTEGPEVTHIVGAPAHPNYPDQGTGPTRGVNMVGGALSGFSIRDGIAWGDGGGVYCQYKEHYSLISNCIITGNTASDGGGAYGVTLKDCEITHNAAGDLNGTGGGTCNSTLFDCTLSYNTGVWGGGAACDHTVTERSKTLFDCTLSNNTGSRGGGARDMTLERCLVLNNTADAWGEGRVLVMLEAV